MIGLVACSRSKRAEHAEAFALYTSPLFRMSYTLACLRCTDVMILSAEHGLVDPRTVLAPYDKRIEQLADSGRQAWGASVIASLDARGHTRGQVWCLASRAYVEAIPFSDLFEVQQPMLGMQIGQRLAWLSSELRKH